MIKDFILIAVFLLYYSHQLQPWNFKACQSNFKE